jgi:signal transduction histidine kinase
MAAGLVISRLYLAETQVRHSYDIEVAIGDLESTLTEVGRTRIAYVNSPSAENLKAFNDIVNNVDGAFTRIRQLTVDNSEQHALIGRLQTIANSRVIPSRESVELAERNQSTPEKQAQITSEIAKGAFETSITTQQIRRNEDNLLQKRNQLSKLLFTVSLIVLSVSFLLSAGMFWLHYRLLNRELRERRSTENQLRQLSLQLIRVQDEEHRRFARELHDGVGQTLTGAKMMADALLAGNSSYAQISELSALLDDALTQTRTISYLFHPPFLDEMGFSSAARWLVDGYARRTGLTISANIPSSEDRMPRSLEFTLYRVLQEALNNIQRHSGSDKAEVSVQIDAKCVTLQVKDYGQGIPGDMLIEFNSSGTRAGVGLMSMKERVKEQGGDLEIRSHATGTEILVKIPISAHLVSENSKHAHSVV